MAEKPARKIPERRCTGCGGHFPKNTLVRIVRSPDGNIALDPTGRAAGRGAYLCRSAACLKKARKSGRLAQNLDTPIPDVLYEQLEGELRDSKP